MILHKQNPLSPQDVLYLLRGTVCHFDLRLYLRNLNLKMDFYLRTFLRLAFYRDRSAHQINDASHDRKSESRSVSRFTLIHALLRKWLEENLLKLFAHSHSVVGHHIVGTKLIVVRGIITDAECDLPALRCKLHRVGEQIKKYLEKPHRINHHINVDLLMRHMKSDPFALTHRLHHIFHFI